jgi:hypothetical protein
VTESNSAVSFGFFLDNDLHTQANPMKQSATAILLSLVLTLAGCGGGGGNNGNINGTWTATLSNPDGTTAFGFTTNFVQGSGNNLNVVSFQFTTSGSCFSGEQTTETGSFALSGDFNGNVTGQFQFTISTMVIPVNRLTLTGTANNGTISGTWTLTGAPGCTGNGNFTMTRS